jgi:succinate dehydrogenase / fumarate reductase cytochrome b subunit
MSSESKCSPLSSVTKKQIMGVTGLLLCGFLLSHLAGNFLLFVGPDAFNKYSHTLVSNPLIYVAEFVLLGLFLSHMFMAFKLTLENKKARPVPYYSRIVSGRGSTFASSTMPYTGLVALVFLVFHILSLKYGPVYSTTIGGVEMRDIYKTTIEYFANPIHVAAYIIAMVSLGIHTTHGFWSAFQSLGFNHPKYMPKIRFFSRVYGLIVMIGFSILPIYCYLQGGK